MIASEPSRALTEALDAVDEFCGAPIEPGGLLVRAKVRALLAGYDARWSREGWKAIAVEQIYTSDLLNPATGRTSRSFEVAGKLDVVAERAGQRFIIDHKTTTQDIAPDSAYWSQLVVEGQVTHYMLLQWLHKEKADGAMWDVIKKPSIAPKKLTKAERASAVADRRYFNRPLSMESLNALQTDERETLEMYEHRLADDCTHERPDRYFARRSVPRLDHELLEYAEDLWQHGQDILASRKVDRLPKNSGACLLYNSPCKFLGICSGHDTPDSASWTRKAVRHGELGEHGDRDALTNSRIRAFQTCKVKHRFEYELCLERHDEEEKEALFFGSMLHAGLEAWWKCFLVQGKDHGCDNEVGTVSGAQR